MRVLFEDTLLNYRCTYLEFNGVRWYELRNDVGALITIIESKNDLFCTFCSQESCGHTKKIAKGSAQYTTQYEPAFVSHIDPRIPNPVAQKLHAEEEVRVTVVAGYKEDYVKCGDMAIGEIDDSVE